MLSALSKQWEFTENPTLIDTASSDLTRTEAILPMLFFPKEGNRQKIKQREAEVHWDFIILVQVAFTAFHISFFLH